MKRIADSMDGVLAITENIDATYKPGKNAFERYILLGVALVPLLSIIVFIIVLDPSNTTTPAGFAIGGILLASLVIALVNGFVTRCSVYSINSSGFARKSPIGIGSWQLSPHEVASAHLDRVKSLWVLVLRPVDGRTRRIPLFSGLVEKFAEQFPYIFQRSVSLRKRYPMWDQRYSGRDYAYGTQPNEFLESSFEHLPKGRILCLGGGEGRNAVWLAQQGCDVTMVDISEVGLRKAKQLAELRGVAITAFNNDLADFLIIRQHWDAIISIFCHLPSALRANLHRRCVEGLAPGGVMLLEAYTPAQLEYGTGGPQKVEMLVDAESLRTELAGLEFLHLQECVRDVREGEYHDGMGAVVQVLAKKV